MASNEKKLNIKDAISMCNYPINIRQSFVKFLENTYGSQKHKLFLFSRNPSAPKLLLLQLQIPSKFNGQAYDISLLVYFPLNFPEIEPEIFFQKIGKVKINPNCTFYIDEDTLKINYSLFFTWEKSFDSFKSLIAELYNQFNIAFPVFNLNNKNNETDKGDDNDCDCVLKKNLCKEVELIKPSNNQKKINNNNMPNNRGNVYQNNNNNNNQNNIYNNNVNNNNVNNNNYNNYNNFNNNKDMNNNMNNLNMGMNNMNLNNNNNNNYRNSDFNKYNRNMGGGGNMNNMNNNNMNNINNRNMNNMNNNNMNNINNRNMNNMNNNYNRNMNNINNQMMNQNMNMENFDEPKAKIALVNLLKNNLSPKINNAMQPIQASKQKLENIKENIIKKIQDYNKVESKENAIRQTINALYKEMDFTITNPQEVEKPDLNNLESILIISNKDYYLRLAKEKAIEEYILITKKNYEKHNIDFNTALNLIRTNTRNIFFLKYKSANPFGC